MLSVLDLTLRHASKVMHLCIMLFNCMGTEAVFHIIMSQTDIRRMFYTSINTLVIMVIFNAFILLPYYTKYILFL